VLTLPGIAGIILTIGMAVDSNVLIFERIKEELRAGKAIPAAIDTGFNKAFLTIIDTHVTTVVSCAFLFMFGTGPVRGFAITLVIGLMANVFTAVFVSKTLFEFSLVRNRAYGGVEYLRDFYTCFPPTRGNNGRRLGV
jgi:preprotein translocase subunit SecD